jgi:hypothetical protein
MPGTNIQPLVPLLPTHLTRSLLPTPRYYHLPSLMSSCLMSTCWSRWRAGVFLLLDVRRRMLLLGFIRWRSMGLCIMHCFWSSVVQSQRRNLEQRAFCQKTTSVWAQSNVAHPSRVKRDLANRAFYFLTLNMLKRAKQP